MAGPDKIEYEQSQQSKIQAHNPGEYIIIGVLFFITGALFVEAAKLPGLFGGAANGSGALPQIMTGTVLLLIVLVTINLIKSSYKQGKIKETISYLFSRDVVILLVAVICYAFLLETLHFKITTLLFLWSCMFFFDRKRPLHKLIIAIGTLIITVFIFSTIFNVLLP